MELHTLGLYCDIQLESGYVGIPHTIQDLLLALRFPLSGSATRYSEHVARKRLMATKPQNKEYCEALSQTMKNAGMQNPCVTQYTRQICITHEKGETEKTRESNTLVNPFSTLCKLPNNL